MQVSVEFQDERLAVEVPEGRPVVAWQGPAGVRDSDVSALVSEALENPLEYPPLRQSLVPGDRVTIALGPDVPEVGSLLNTVCRVLGTAAVEPESITVLLSPDTPPDRPVVVPEGVTVVRHDPDDRTQLSYLAATTDERRVYLNRLLADADFVLPVGRLSYDPVLGYRGPWSVLFPDLSDTQTRRSYRTAGAHPQHPGPLFKESGEVSWLLGSQFQIGLVAGVSGLLEVVAGLGSAVMDRGARRVDDAWSVRVDSRAELVIVGVGLPGAATGIEDVARALATATNLVQRGGKIVVLSRAVGELGPAMQRLVAVDDPRVGPSALRGHEADRDYAAARRLAQALAWADVYLLSALDRDDVEGLSMIALDRPEEARRLVAVSGSCLVVSHADLARAVVADETE